MATIARLLLYVAAMMAMGDVCAQRLRGAAWHSPFATGRRQFLLIAWLAGLTALLMMFVLQFLALDLALTFDDVAMLVRQTTWGNGWLVLAALALAGVATTLRRATLVWQLVVASAFAVAMGGLGHAAADDTGPLLSRFFDAIHVLGVTVWLGTLLCLSMEATMISWERFSAMATVAAPLSILSGLGSAWRRVGAATVTQTIGSDYGRLLAIKLAIVVVILLLGAWHRQRMRAQQLPTAGSVRFELTLALLALGATALLTGTAPPGD